jgi:hypothetical protein
VGVVIQVSTSGWQQEIGLRWDWNRVTTRSDNAAWDGVIGRFPGWLRRRLWVAGLDPPGACRWARPTREAGTPGQPGNTTGASDDPTRRCATRPLPIVPYRRHTSTTIGGINGDMTGMVVGQVAENVYDTVVGNYLLIPQGARLID